MQRHVVFMQCVKGVLGNPPSGKLDIQKHIVQPAFPDEWKRFEEAFNIEVNAGKTASADTGEQETIVDSARADGSEDAAGQTAACVDAIKDSALSKAAELRTRYVGVIHPTTWTAAVVGSLLESRKMPCLGNGTGMDGSLLAVFDPKCDEDKCVAPLKNWLKRSPPINQLRFAEWAVLQPDTDIVIDVFAGQVA